MRLSRRFLILLGLAAAPIAAAGERASQLLSRLQGTPHRLAFVEGEGGEHIGIVTIEDLIEEFLGDMP